MKQKSYYYLKYLVTIYIFVVFIVGYLLKEEAEKQFSLQCYIILPKNDNVYLLLMLNKC